MRCFVRRLIVGVLGCMVLIAAEAAAAASASTNPTVLEGIAICLSHGQEAVLFAKPVTQPSDVHCEEHRKGANYHRKQMPDFPRNVDPAQACGDQSAPNDGRRLAPDAIKILAAQKHHPVAPAGIRIVGAIFCQEVDLVGLELPYSLVLDRVFFKEGIHARNFRTKADFSVDESFIFKTLRLTRVHIEGSIFGSSAFIEGLFILDSEITSSLFFRKSVLFGGPELAGLRVGREMSVRGSALSNFHLQFSTIGGVLDLSESEARCAYHVKKSEIGELVAVDVGFGTTLAGSKPDKRSYAWERVTDPKWGAESFGEPVATLLASPTIKAVVGDSEECTPRTKKTPFRSDFLLSDNRVRLSVCLRSFHWLSADKAAPDPGKLLPQSAVTLNAMRVGGVLTVNLWPSDAKADGIAAGTRTFEAVEVDTGTLILDFKDTKQAHTRHIDGLRFHHVYAADIQCAYHPLTSGSATFVSEERSRLTPPKVDDVLAWLKGTVKTTQPYAAFADAYKRVGDDGSATELNIKRATIELDARLMRLLTPVGRVGVVGPVSTPTAQAAEPADLSMSAEIGLFEGILETLAVSWRYLLYLIADHGYKPGQVIWVLLLILLGYFAWFWSYLHVVGFEAKSKNNIRPIGFLFLFDRLIPAYKIREDHYEIVTFYRRATRQDEQTDPEPTRIMRYMGRDVRVIRADGREANRAEAGLDLLKAVGIGLTVFLAAAVNALVTR
jgi:hypothetical protein